MKNAGKTAPLIVGLGELLADVFPDGERPGGAPANVTFHAKNLGAEGQMVSRVGRDERGKTLRAYLKKHGIGLSYIQEDPERPTGWVTVTMGDEGKATYVIHQDVAWDYIAFDPILDGLAKGADAICFGSLCQRQAVSRQSIHTFLDSAGPDTLRVFDVNLRQEFYSEEVFRESLKKAQVVKISDEEVEVFSELLDLPAEQEPAIQALFEQFDLQYVALTLGADGCILAQPGKMHRQPGKKVDVVDTVGAGDSFTARLTLGILRQEPLETIAREAVEYAGYVCTLAGAMPEESE